MSVYETIAVERPDPRVARIVMNRPEARNAQNLQMTYDLNAAFDARCRTTRSRSSSWRQRSAFFRRPRSARPGAKNEAGIDFPPVWTLGRFRRAGGARPLRARAGDLSADHAALAQSRQADDRRGARQAASPAG